MSMDICKKLNNWIVGNVSSLWESLQIGEWFHFIQWHGHTLQRWSEGVTSASEVSDLSLFLSTLLNSSSLLLSPPFSSSPLLHYSSPLFFSPILFTSPLLSSPLLSSTARSLWPHALNTVHERCSKSHYITHLTPGFSEAVSYVVTATASTKCINPTVCSFKKIKIKHNMVWKSV